VQRLDIAAHVHAHRCHIGVLGTLACKHLRAHELAATAINYTFDVFL